MIKKLFGEQKNSFIWRAITAATLVCIGDFFFFQDWLPGLRTGLFSLCLLLGALVTQSRIWRDRRALTAAILASAFSLALIIQPSLLAWVMCWAAISMAAMLPSTAAFDDGWRWFQRLFLHALRSLVAPIIDLFKLQKAKKRRKGPSLRALIPILALPIVGSGIIIALFANANPIIAKFLNTLSFPEPSSETVWRMILWGIILVLSWGIVRPKVSRKLLSTFDGTSDLSIPGVTIASVTLSLILFNLLFAAQNALDIAYLWSGQGLPDGMTMAQYAHRGAYPLIATALLAGLFVLVTLRPGSKTAEVTLIRYLVLLWIGQNLFLVASSMLRTIDYIDAYSLTQLRIWALAWMGLVGVGLLLICWRMFTMAKASWLINANLIAAGVLLGALCFTDSGEIAAGWNVKHAKEVGGKGVHLDLCYLENLGSSALLPLVVLEEVNVSKPFNTRVRQARQLIMSDMMRDRKAGYWTWRDSIRLENAWQRLGPEAQDSLQNASRSCDAYGDVSATESEGTDPAQGEAGEIPPFAPVPKPLLPQTPSNALTQEREP